MNKHIGENNTTRRRKFVFTSFSLIMVVLLGHAQSIQFNQLNFNYNGTTSNNSDWGAANLTFTGNAAILYFNLTVDTTWSVENMPVLTTRGIGQSQTQRFWFKVGPAGTQVSTLTYGFSLTPGPSGKPTATQVATVTPDTVTIYSGFSGGTGGGTPGTAGKQTGGVATVSTPKKHDNFPNQESPTNYCVPTGVSNSLQWLNSKYSLGMNPSKISINALAAAFGTTTGNGTERSTIFSKKKNYCQNKKNNLPITSRHVKGSHISEIVDEVKNGQDVELMVTWPGTGGKGHCVAVTGGTDLGGGKYALLITHDSKQNQAGGTVDETAIYDKNNKKWDGALSAASGQSGEILYIIECPTVKSKQTTNLLPGGNSHKFISNSGTEYDNGKYRVYNLEMTGYTNNVNPPVLNNMTIFGFGGTVNLAYSADTGNTFQNCQAIGQMVVRVKHIQDSAGVQYYDTEILQMNIQGGTLPPGILIRENPVPADSSKGLMTLRQIQGGWEIASFFDVFTELSTDGGATWMPDENETTVIYADGPAVFQNLTLQNITLNNAQSECFDATQTISVAGNGTTFNMENGAECTLIAGQNILLQPGTTVQPGGHLNAYITTTGQYCSSPSLPMAPTVMGDEEIPINLGDSFFKVYPNPTTGIFTLEFTHESEPVTINIDIYTMMGEKIATEKVTDIRRFEFSLSGRPAGIYIIRVTAGDRIETSKMIKY